MTTSTFNHASQTTGDADWRVLVAAISDALTTVGFIKSADTGQINTGTTTRPSSGAYAGYEIRYFNDSLHASKPCYVKFEYGRGTSNAASALTIRVTVGSGTNGSGTINGTTYFAQLEIPYQNNFGPAGTYQWYICAEDGYVAIAAARGMINGQWFWSLCRTSGDDGEHNSEGFLMYYAGPTLVRQRYITTEVNDASAVAFIPGNVSSLGVGGDKQVLRHYAVQPTIRCVPHFLCYISADIGNESTFSETPSGSRSRTFLTLGGTSACPTTASANNIATHLMAMQYD